MLIMTELAQNLNFIMFKIIWGDQR